MMKPTHNRKNAQPTAIMIQSKPAPMAVLRQAVGRGAVRIVEPRLHHRVRIERDEADQDRQQEPEEQIEALRTCALGVLLDVAPAPVEHDQVQDRTAYIHARAAAEVGRFTRGDTSLVVWYTHAKPQKPGQRPARRDRRPLAAGAVVAVDLSGFCQD